MLRKLLVNDVVHSFCYCVRKQRRVWPHVILGIQPIDGELGEITAADLAPFVIYANIVTWNYSYVLQHIAAVSWALRRFSLEERSYASYLMSKYYVGKST